MYVSCIISASAGSVRKRPKASGSTEIKGLDLAEIVDTSTTRRTDPFRGSFQRADWRAASQSDAFSVGELYNVEKKSSIFELLLPKTLFFELKVFKKRKNTPHGSFQRADWSGSRAAGQSDALSVGELYNVEKNAPIFELFCPKLYFSGPKSSKRKKVLHGSFQLANWSGQPANPTLFLSENL